MSDKVKAWYNEGEEDIQVLEEFLAGAVLEELSFLDQVEGLFGKYELSSPAHFALGKHNIYR
jgi:hypothetical protein